jgi:Zn-dependent protease with chaperone function
MESLIILGLIIILIIKSAQAPKNPQTPYESVTPQVTRNIYPHTYRVRGEQERLYACLGICAFIFFILLEMNLALVLFIVALSAAWVKIRQGQLLGSSVKVSEHQLPEVHRAARVAAERLSMKMPDVFVKQDPVINAYALGFLGKKSVILHSATVESMNEDELISIMGHEFSHIKCNHTNWLVITNSAESVVRVPILSDILGFIFLAWSRKAEYTCDRAGLLASRNFQACITALAKAAVGKQLFEKLNLPQLINQKRDVDQDEISKWSELLSNHPYVVNRIHELGQFYGSDLYRRLTEDGSTNVIVAQ